VSHGLVTRERRLDDRRAVLVRLTPLGHEMVDRLFPEHTARVSAAFSALDEEEMRSLSAICRKLAA
jgi:MarR family transcriptional regulator, 2-MHQ and catechol-resistance regulon repressor